MFGLSGWVIVGDCFDFVGFMLVCWWLLMLVGGVDLTLVLSLA